MADFKPVSPPAYVFDAGGTAHTVYGWWSHNEWNTMEPVVGNPDGPGINRWSVYYGDDPFTTG